MAIPNQMSFLLLQIPSLLLFFWAQSSSAQFRPLCITQFALANQACCALPSLEAPPVLMAYIAEHQNDTNNNTNADNQSRLRDNESKSKHCKDDDPKHCKDDDDHKHDKDVGHKHCKDDDPKHCKDDDDHKHKKDDGHKHCKDDDPKHCKDDDDHKHDKDDGHKHCKDDDPKHCKDDDHDHHDGHHDHDNIPSEYKNCCRWLEVVDHECVCEALLKLPPFLVKQEHEYTITVGKACKFNYKCPCVN